MLLDTILFFYFFGLFFSFLTLINVEAVIGKSTPLKFVLWIVFSWFSFIYWSIWHIRFINKPSL